MNVSSSAAAKPPLKPSPSEFGDDFLIESENFLDLCEKTLIDVEATVIAVDSLISAVYGALDAPLFGESEVGGFDFPFSETPVGSSRLVSDFDYSIVPETAFDDPMEGFVPDSEDEAVEAGAVTAEEAAATMEEGAVTAEEEAPLSDVLEEMIGLLLPAYLKLVRSFP